MLLKSAIIFYFCIWFCDGVLHNRYDGHKTTKEDLSYYQKYGTVNNCTIYIEPCNASDWRRTDGTCNNLKDPARGTYFAAMPRLLPAHYHNGSYARKSVTGKDLPLPRLCRTTLLLEGVSHHQELSLLVNSFGIFMFIDVGSVHDINNFLFTKTDCCQKEHRNDYQCSPNIIPADDPVHRFSGINCLNLTRPLTYQDFYCTKDTVPAPIVEATVCYDLSNIYNVHDDSDQAVRSFTGGKLAVEEEDGKTWPPNGPISNCPLNEEKETRCFKNYLNGLLPTSLFTVWFMRNHNDIAEKLAAVNPCWDDERLFQTARDINIAMSQQINVYEWMVAVIGRKNLLKAGVISEDCGFRDLYNEHLYPGITLEFSHALRWFHTNHDGSAQMYDTNGTFIDAMSVTNLSLRPGWLAKDNHMTYVTQGAFRQRAKDTDHSVHPNIAEIGIPVIQKAVDIVTSDLHKSRLFGMAPYIDYVYLSSGINITCFDDLIHVMAEEKIEDMEKLYEDVRDIDLMAGLWSEKMIKGGRIPRTLAYFIINNILKNIRGDRHWYEREHRPHAFTYEQLKEIRKVKLSSILCNVGDGVTEIQKDAFYIISKKNPLVSCSEIPQMDYSAWSDPACKAADASDDC